LNDRDLWSRDAAKASLVTAAAIVTPVLTVWGLLRSIGRTVIATSARGAKRFLDNTADPMRLVQDHIRDLVQWVGYDIVIMIDDLDRCRGPYVVELLEGVQTLFRDVPITYVVAADRDWLADSYAAEYTAFGSASGEAGRPVGYLFLEKTFQVSAGLPRAGRKVDEFWSRILRTATVPGQAEIEQARSAADAELGGIPRAEARRRVADNGGDTPAEVQARREVVAMGMVSESAQREDTHTLEPFRALLGRDPNPRMMKRLVNAYGIARAIDTLQGSDLGDDTVREEQTALWTILTLRWPVLGAHLVKYPEHLDAFGAGPVPERVPTALRSLFDDPDVLAVVHGDAPNVTARLDGQSVRELVLL
jgi:hypothetical protein